MLQLISEFTKYIISDIFVQLILLPGSELVDALAHLDCRDRSYETFNICNLWILVIN
jgi:hypothetical protein